MSLFYVIQPPFSDRGQASKTRSDGRRGLVLTVVYAFTVTLWDQERDTDRWELVALASRYLSHGLSVESSRD